ncbi:MAG TPA: hypothetical protein VK708_00415 [Bryobacteraceae bacterium]|nr:hypothetical protein [Bryobacteraceae bacterium]
MERDCDQVTSDMGLGNEGYKYAALGTHCGSPGRAGSRRASRRNGRGTAENGMAGAVVGNGPDKSRNGIEPVKEGTAANAGG